ncbi:DUF3365 domain-containing protein [bacterium]|nr:DUF3365 domain-containing protein [bacterium]
MSMLKRMSLQGRVICVGVVLPGAIIGALLLMFVSEARSRAVAATVDKARAVCLTAEAAAEQKQSEWDLGVVTLEQIRAWITDGHTDRALSSVPVMTACQAVLKKAEAGGYKFRVPSLQPRNAENTATPLEAAALQQLRDGTNSESFVLDDETNTVHYFRPIRLTQDCLICHGDPKTSEALWGNSDGVDLTGYLMENWKAGDMHGAFEIVQSLDEADAAVAAGIRKASLFALGGLCGTGLFTLLIVRCVTERVGSSGKQITSAVGGVTASVDELVSASQQLNASITEITGSAGRAADIAGRAVDEAASTSNAICRLVDSGARISQVVKVINQLAEQTNLLALNATIEAARAGEAGKGFAVVANEVKELANQTSKATDEINGSIEAIRTDSQVATQCVDRINEIIARVSEAQQSIASAVQEQGAATSDISHHIGQVARSGRSIRSQVETVFQQL